jgi:hypothetical protein
MFRIVLLSQKLSKPRQGDILGRPMRNGAGESDLLMNFAGEHIEPPLSVLQ